MCDENGFLSPPKGFATMAIHVGQEPEQWDSMSVVPPIVMSTTFKQYGPGEFKKYEYGRSGNPSRDVVEKCLAAIEGAKYTVTFASCIGAITALIGTFENGDHIVTGEHADGGTSAVFTEIATRFGMEISSVDFTDLDNVKNGIRPNTKLIWTETPTSPTLEVIDIKAVAKIAEANNILLAIDNTFLTPYFQRPLELGAHFSVYSLTKFMNGHNDVMMGSISTNNTESYEKLVFLQNAMGIVPSPFNCALLNRSLKTLALRMRQHFENSIGVAEFLEAHPKVLKVVHPGLPSHPQHEIFKKQTSGHSGMVGVYLKADLNKTKEFLKELKIFAVAPSLGGIESLISLPALMTNAKSAPESYRVRMKITDNYLRISVGLEDVEDLIEDLQQALKKL